ncbi:hypothetical protein BG015_002437 [Linnemannia schmuckeri]|uniref:Uncharacterized protein n=1 Tax=Linnemannia schmuckeri TaxID=64567 RepID=A0A9P5RNJ9_9FUNG|nr:hypothetical protein BG015_002437 [Linnemannia schmuckeri]
MILKKHKWNAKKARTQEYRLVADRLLQLVGGSTGAKRDKDNKVVIGVGLGKFSSKIRLSSLHESFQSYFTQKARALGYIVFQKYMHRDIMAGHNICNAIRGHLLDQQRPKVTDGNYPWMQRKCSFKPRPGGLVGREGSSERRRMRGWMEVNQKQQP